MSVAVSDFSLVESAESMGIRLPHYLQVFLDRQVSFIAESPIPELKSILGPSPRHEAPSLLMQLAASHQAAGGVGRLECRAFRR